MDMQNLTKKRKNSMYSLFVFLDKFQNLMHYDVIKDGSLNLFKMYTRALTLSFSSSGRLSNLFSLKEGG